MFKESKGTGVVGMEEARGRQINPGSQSQIRLEKDFGFYFA